MSSIAFLGAGNIAQAIMGGLIENGFSANNLTAYDPSEVCRKKASSLGVRAAESNVDAIADADIVMLCVKPNVVLEVIESIAASFGNQLVISVAAGITVTSILGKLPEKAALVRCMPNTPALVQMGMTALYASAEVTARQKGSAEEVLGAVGQTLWVADEADLDAVTAVSGSGPAYFFLMMESMINAGISEGLSSEVAQQLVLQTALGAAKMAIESPLSPQALREQVTSPGGTTQAAIEHFQSSHYGTIVSEAVRAARIRSIELSKG